MQATTSQGPHGSGDGASGSHPVTSMSTGPGRTEGAPQRGDRSARMLLSFERPARGRRSEGTSAPDRKAVKVASQRTLKTAQ